MNSCNHQHMIPWNNLQFFLFFCADCAKLRNAFRFSASLVRAFFFRVENVDDHVRPIRFHKQLLLQAWAAAAIHLKKSFPVADFFRKSRVECSGIGFHQRDQFYGQLRNSREKSNSLEFLDVVQLILRNIFMHFVGGAKYSMMNFFQYSI